MERLSDEKKPGTLGKHTLQASLLHHKVNDKGEQSPIEAAKRRFKALCGFENCKVSKQRKEKR